MLLRLAKIVVAPAHADRIPAEYHAYSETWARRQSGCLSVRLLRDVVMRNKFFLLSYWRDEASMLAAVKGDAFADILAEARRDFLERLSLWVCDIVDADDDRALLAARAREVVSRLVKVTVRPGRDADMLAEYYRVTEAFSRRQEGCLRVHLFRDRQTPNVYFLQSYWRDLVSLRRLLQSPGYDRLRTSTSEYFEERIREWLLDIVEDDGALPVYRSVE